MNAVEKHLFSIFYSETSSIAKICKNDDIFSITDQTLIKRIRHILRLNVHEQIILFDRKQHLICELIEIKKSYLSLRIIEKELNKIDTLEIIIVLAVLKKDALEQAVYRLSEISVSEIILIKAEKSKIKLEKKDLDRLAKIIIAAAEQSKNFKFPLIYYIPDVHQAIARLDSPGQKIICDVQADKKLFDVVDEQQKKYVLAIGPEGDFTSTEKKLFEENNFNRAWLTATVLRAEDAAFLAAGILQHHMGEFLSK